MKEEQLGADVHAGRAKEHLEKAYKELLKAAEKNDIFDFKKSCKRELLESSKQILEMLDTQALR